MIKSKTTLCMVLMIAVLFPLGAMAGCHIDFAELGLKDSIPTKLPLQKDNIIVSFDKDNCTFNSKQNTFSFSKGATITVKSNNGEMITGIRLLTVNKEDKVSAKKKKTKFFSCDSGKFDNGIWKGSSDAVTFQCLENCSIAGIRTSLSTDSKEAYAVRLYNEYGYDDGLVGYGLIFHFDEKKSLYDEHFNGDEWWYPVEVYSINDNTEYPEWYGVDFNVVIFDASFANYHPKSTCHWFDGQNCKITDIQFLNTSEVTNMSYMFANYDYNNGKFEDYDEDYWGEPIMTTIIFENFTQEESFFSSIFNLFDFSSVRDMSHMFSNCGMLSFSISSPNIPSSADLTHIAAV